MKSAEWQRLKHEAELCADCPSLVYSRALYNYAKPTFGNGNLDAKLVVVGQCPGMYGAGQTGVPFTRDRSGKLYRLAMESSGLTDENTYTTNAVKCCPENNRSPTKAEVTNCSRILAAELELLKPAVVISLGLVAQFEVSKINGWIPFAHIKLMHPAYYLRIGQERKFIDEFKKAVEQVNSVFKLKMKQQTLESFI